MKKAHGQHCIDRGYPLPEFRNRIMHPVRPVVLDQQDVKELYAVVRFLEKLKNRAIEVLKPETKA
jgi:hypothetical protein